MKKLIFVLLALATMLLVSCVVTSYDQPRRTAIGAYVASDITDQIAQSTLLVEMVKGLQMWKAAPTVEARYEIEDRYFSGVKIREMGDTIFVVNICKVNTFNKQLGDSKWELIYFSAYPHVAYKYEIGKLSATGYTLDRMNGGEAGSVHLTVDFTNSDCRVTGEGDHLPLWGLYYDRASYKIREVLRFELTNGIGWFGMKAPVAGKLDIVPAVNNVSVAGDAVSVRYLPDGAELSFKGVTEYYHSFTDIYD